MSDCDSRTKARATPGQRIGAMLKYTGLICVIAGVAWSIVMYDFSGGLFAGPAGWLFGGGICLQLVGAGTISRADQSRDGASECRRRAATIRRRCRRWRRRELRS